jgi:hypothetical protein
MSWLIAGLIRWLVSAVVTMAAVRVVTPANPRNTLSRAMGVTFLVAILVTPLTWWLPAILILPFLVGMVAWFAIFMIAYNLGPLQAAGVGLLEVLIGWLVSVAVRSLSQTG